MIYSVVAFKQFTTHNMCSGYIYVELWNKKIGTVSIDKIQKRVNSGLFYLGIKKSGSDEKSFGHRFGFGLNHTLTMLGFCSICNIQKNF